MKLLWLAAAVASSTIAAAAAWTIAAAAAWTIEATAARLAAQDPSSVVDPKDVRAALATHAAMAATSPFRSAAWTFIGPTNVAVRSVDVAVAERPSGRRIYSSYKTGGLWKSDDGGATWQPLTEHVPFVGMHVVAVAPTNPDEVWIGTAGGVFKSVDAGLHWTYVGLVGAGGFELQDEATFGRIVIHPTDARIVYVAAQGLGVGGNQTRGVFKTLDGGQTWTRVLFRGPATGAVDLVMDPRNPETLYASMWQQIYSEAGGFGANDRDSNGTSIWKTRDGGATWTETTTGLPAPRYRGRMGIDISRSNPNMLYLLLDSFELLRAANVGEVNRLGAPSAGQFVGAEVYRTSDGGGTWAKVSRRDSKMIGHGSTYGASFGQIRVDPWDENTVFTAGIQLHRSTNGGRDFAVIGKGAHVDHRGLLLDPRLRGVFYDCTDGGLYIFSGHGKSFTFTPVPTAQFYNLAIDHATPFHVYGSVQDHGSFRGVVSLGGPPVAFDQFHGYEMASHAVNSAGTILFTNAGPPPSPSLVRATIASGARKRVNPAVPATEPALRRTWLQPIIISRHDERTVYAGFQSVFRSRTLGDDWERISGDLTAVKDSVSGQAAPWQVILSLAESPLERGLLYAGTPLGLHVTRDDGKSWEDLSANLVERRPVAGIVASAFDTGTVYVWHPVTNVQRTGGRFLPFIFKSTDYGHTFVSISSNLPTGPVFAVREDPANRDILYAGTMVGIYVTTDGGKQWHVLGNLPVVPVTDIQIHPTSNVIVIATHGRGIWAMDARVVRPVVK